MFNDTGVDEFEDFIPIIGIVSFMSIIFFCCICNKKTGGYIRKLQVARYQSLTNNEMDNNYNENTQNTQNIHTTQTTRGFPKINFNDTNNEQPPPYR